MEGLTSVDLGRDPTHRRDLHLEPARELPPCASGISRSYTASPARSTARSDESALAALWTVTSRGPWPIHCTAGTVTGIRAEFQARPGSYATVAAWALDGASGWPLRLARRWRSLRSSGALRSAGEPCRWRSALRRRVRAPPGQPSFGRRPCWTDGGPRWFQWQVLGIEHGAESYSAGLCASAAQTAMRLLPCTMAREAELIILGASIEAVSGLFVGSGADGLAVTGGRIAAIGPTAEIRSPPVQAPGWWTFAARRWCRLHRRARASTRGRPGLQRMPSVRPLRRGSVPRAIAEYAAAHPDRPWITGGGWSLPDFPGGTPRREILDQVVRTDRRSSTTATATGSGSTRRPWRGRRRSETPDPVDGRIERDAEGDPSGTLHDGAIELVCVHVPPTSHEDLVAGLLAAQRSCTRWASPPGRTRTSRPPSSRPIGPPPHQVG